MRSDWVFNLERAYWWVGAFERMVKSTKCCLHNDWKGSFVEFYQELSVGLSLHVAIMLYYVTLTGLMLVRVASPRRA